MNTVERIKNVCKERKIAISKLEKDCGFANGYIGQLKKGTMPDDRLNIVADYLKVSAIELSKGEKPWKRNKFLTKSKCSFRIYLSFIWAIKGSGYTSSNKISFL